MKASSKRTERLASERIAVNTPIQGSQADMIKLAMLDISKRFRAEKLNSRMVLQVKKEDERNRKPLSVTSDSVSGSFISSRSQKLLDK